MASQRKQSGARHPRSPLPRQQTVREKLKNVQRKPVPPIPSPRTPADGGNGGAAGSTISPRVRLCPRGTPCPAN
jgi:hypothetical protein